MNNANPDEKTVAIVIALGICVLTYIAGAFIIAGLNALFDFGDGVGRVLSVLLLMVALMAAAVILLRDKGRRTPR